LIFSVLCLSVLAVLSLSTANFEKKMAEKAAQAATDYYNADLKATQIAASLSSSYIESGSIPDNVGGVSVDVRRDGARTYASYGCMLSDTQTLFVQLAFEEAGAEILSWKNGYDIGLECGNRAGYLRCRALKKTDGIYPVRCVYDYRMNIWEDYMGADIIKYLQTAVEKGASDIFIISGLPVSLKRNGVIVSENDEIVMPQLGNQLVTSLYELASRDMGEYLKTGDDDFSVSVKGLSRFRVSTQYAARLDGSRYPCCEL
jgi:hypothetical protein